MGWKELIKEDSDEHEGHKKKIERVKVSMRDGRQCLLDDILVDEPADNATLMRQETVHSYLTLSFSRVTS
jgi:hypothetical protein